MVETEFNNSNFIFYRQDRPTESGYDRGGGIMIGVNKKLNSGICDTLEITNPNYE